MCPANNERRSLPRNAFDCPVEFVTERNGETITLTAKVINISESGLRIYLSRPLAEGQEILVSDPLPNGHQRYTVQWSNKVLENFFEIGLKSSQ